jgi:succinoglycan biosynthesis transport protein ExoP
MQLSLILRIIRSRFLLIATTFAVTVLMAIVGSLLMTKQYQATTEIHVDVRGVDPVTGASIYSQQTPQQYLATQVDIIKSERVIRHVIDSLKLEQNDILREIWTRKTGGIGDLRGFISQTLLDSVDVDPSIDGSTIKITYQATDAKMAADVAQAFATGYIASTVDLKVEPAKEAAKWFEAEAAIARKAVEDAQRKLSNFQLQSGIVASDERFDVDNQRLNELSTQLVTLQSAAAQAKARLDAIKRHGRQQMPEVVGNALIQALSSEVSKAETRVRELSSRLGSNNPQFISATAELNSLRAQLQQEVQRVAGSIEADAAITLQREAMVRKELQEQRDRVLKLKRQRDEMSVLQRDVDSAQKALDQLIQRYQDTKVTSRASLTNVSILSNATVPEKPSRPKLLLNTAVGAFLGLFLGILAAVSLESMQKPLRTAEDLLMSTQVPVLAVLPPSNSTRPQRLIGGGGPTIGPPALRLGH